MSTTYVDKPLSLIERKKLQWAKEKEELARLCAPWSSPKENENYDRPFARTRHVPKFAMANHNEFFRKDFSTANSRRSSLPPLSKNYYYNPDKETGGGETSGYGSDNPTQPPETDQTNNWNQSGYESSSSFKDDRPKWRDIKNGKFWDQTENDPPNWVKRGLQRDQEIVVSNTSPAESPQQDDAEAERPFTSCSSSLNRTFIRGQNVPVDSTELAERERRRQIALAHQEAIRQQLDERERRRQEEKQKRIKEEQEEELRIEREQEIERQRKESEMRALREKQDRERKRKEAIQEALEIAEKEAKLEKMKQKLIKQNTINEQCKEETKESNHNNKTVLVYMAKLDDFLGKKKETAPILDLSKTVANSQEEFRRLLEKVPDFKMKAEKVHMENIKIKDKKFKYKSGKKDVKAMKEPYTFPDPLPREMKNLKISELAAVPIDWKMLTTIRPKSKMEENYFSRLVELKKLENKTRAFEKRQFAVDPQIRKLKNKAGVVEMRIVSCVDCGEDFCNGKDCSKYTYDSFARLPEVSKVSQKLLSPETSKTDKPKRRIKRKSRSKSKGKRTKSKSKSPKASVKKK